MKRPPRAAQAPPGRLFAGSAYDPAASGELVAWQRPDGTALLRTPNGDEGLPGRAPALGGPLLAWLEGQEAVLADAGSRTTRGRVGVPGAGAIALSGSLIAWRARDGAGSDAIYARTLGGDPGPVLLVLQAPAGDELGRPAVTGDTVLVHVAGFGGSRLLAIQPATGAQELLREEAGAMLTNPATDGERLLYVRATGRQQELRLGSLVPGVTRNDETLAVHPSSGRRDREHEHGRTRHRHRYRDPLPPRASPGEVQTLWSTALGPGAAYVTRLIARPQGRRTADILRVTL